MKLILTALILGIALEVANACLSSGVGCCGGCQQQQPAYSGCNCQAGYECGRYGCYRARNRVAVASVKTKEVQTKHTKGDRVEITENKSGNGSFLLPTDHNLSGGSPIEPLIKTKNLDKADETFMTCCETRDLPDTCLKHCTFGRFTRDALLRMYLKQDPCPVQAVAEMQYCAAQGNDHTECCQQGGVARTLAGPKCLILCDQVPGNVHKLDTSYMSCFDRFESMKACFWRDIMKDHRNNGVFN